MIIPLGTFLIMTPRPAVATAIAALTFSLTACGGGGVHNYATVEDLRDGVVAAGLGCSTFERTSDTQATCGTTILVVMPNADDREAFAQIIVGQNLLFGDAVLSGGNWLVAGSRHDLEMIQPELGGAIEEEAS